MTINEIIKTETETRMVRFWGEDYEISPALVEKVFGNGDAIMYFTPMDTRPNYYIVRVDSSIVNDEDVAINFIDSTLLDAIEEEFGKHEEDEDDYPALNCDCGYSWCFEADATV